MNTMFQLLVISFLFGQSFGQPDAACQAWLDSPQGQNFSACESTFPGFPMRTPDNNCTLTQDDFDSLCGDACYATLMDAYAFFLQNGTCLDFYNTIFGACSTNDDCIGTGFGTRVCIEGVCYTSCNTTDDCNSCDFETCNPLGQSQVCVSGMTEAVGNGTSTFRGIFYQLETTCVTNDAGNFCTLLLADYIENANSVDCSQFNDWGCCLGTLLDSMEFCGSMRFTDPAFYQCNASNITCVTLPAAETFCAIAINGTESSSTGMTGSSGMTGSTGMTGLNMTSSTGMTGLNMTSSTGMTGLNMTSSTGMTGMTGSSSMTGGSSIIITGSSGLVGGTGSTGEGSGVGAVTVSWSLLLGLLAVTRVLS